MGAEVVRDAGLRRASTLTKWIGVGAVALMGAFAGFVAQAKPGRSTGSTQAATNRNGSASAPTLSDQADNAATSTDDGSSSPTLAPPPAPPAPASTPAPVVSGGS
jgi:hypothetical protein